MQKLLMTTLIGILLMGSGRGAIGFLHKAPAGGKIVTVEMKEFRFIPSQMTVERGRVTFEVRNSGELPHVFQVTGPGVDTHIALLPAGATTLDVPLTMPGEYTLICPIPTHPEQGMRGSIVVR
ncbi:MAG: cupredoxin domain-containing protein [Candidatus Entotheonellia bacterium]